MDFKSLIKNKDFATGFIIGLLLTFGRAYSPFLEKVLRPVFDFWISVLPTGILLEIVPLYISGVVIFMVVWFVFLKKYGQSFRNSLLSFSFGFLLSFVVFLILVLVAISQFKFTQ